MLNLLKVFLLSIFFAFLIQNSSSVIQVNRITSTGTECSLCEFAANYVEGYLAQNYTEVEIETVLDKVCELGPNSFVQECDSFINAEVPNIISEFENYETPEEVCSQLGYC